MSLQEKCVIYVPVFIMGVMGIIIGLMVTNTPDDIRQQLGIGFVMLVAATVPTLMFMMCAALDNGGWSQRGKLVFVGMISSYTLGLWAGYVFLPLLQK